MPRGMLNRYPWWKNLLILAVVLAGLVYASPNLYPPDFAIQISTESSDLRVSQATLNKVQQALSSEGLEFFGAELTSDGNALVRLTGDVAQRRAQELAKRALAELSELHIVALNLAPTTPDWLRSIGAQPMKYGLDLRGGVHFLMEVNTEKTLADRMESYGQEIRKRLRDERIRYRTTDLEDGILKIGFTEEEVRDRAFDLVTDRYGEFIIERPEELGQFMLTLTLTSQAIDDIEDHAVRQNVQTLRGRVNELGVSEPLIQKLGRNRIVVDLPGVQDTAQAKKILGKVATLEFHWVASPDTSRSRTEEFEYEGRLVSIDRSIITHGDRVLDARVGYDPETSLPQVDITLDGEGGERMHRETRTRIGRRMAVVFIETRTRPRYLLLDGREVQQQEAYTERRLISVATVQAALGNRFRITGLSAGEARDLALLLRAGALAADMYIAEERTVGASLGEENVRMGALSVAVGLILVLGFMLVYYRAFGLVANCALAANLVLVVALMSALSATLTLPGIAGIVLTLGMAVDANVLIFARIREELRNGLSPQKAISVGFDQAFITILDANLTTLLVALILYSIGTGPVKGFAITLSIGILTSMFTAILGSRAIINLAYGGRNLKKLAI